MKLIEEVSTKILDKISGLVDSINLNRISSPHDQEMFRVTSEIIQNLSTAYKELIKSKKV